MTLALQGSGVMAPEWSLDTAAGGCAAASCVQAPEWGRSPQNPPRVQSGSVLPVGDTGRVRFQACFPLLTMVSG